MPATLAQHHFLTPPAAADAARAAGAASTPGTPSAVPAARRLDVGGGAASLRIGFTQSGTFAGRGVPSWLGPNATFEERRDMSVTVMNEVLHRDEEKDMQEAVSDAEEVEVGGRRYCRGEIVEQIAELEQVAREAAAVPREVASVSCGLDRFSVRMSEAVDADEGHRPGPRRTEPYELTPPPPREHHYRKAWVGSTTVHDAEGNALHTWRYSVEAGADRNALADRIAADLAWVLREHPTIPVHCVQDAAPELRALPEALSRVLPSEVTPRELVDFEHLANDYLDEVVDTCEPKGDPHDMKGWYRAELLRDDRAIDRIWRSLREKSKKLAGRNTRARKAVAAALSYIRRRKDKMRYASHYAAKLPIGSGATESICWEMQRRVQRPGQSWEIPGLRGTLALRAFVFSERWSAAWKPYAAAHRETVN